MEADPLKTALFSHAFSKRKIRAQDKKYHQAIVSARAIPKTSDISLVFHWNIGFLGISNLVDKAVSLIIQSQANVENLLLIGGLALNDAFTTILKRKLPKVKVDIHEYSHLFEAYGTMLLVRENPQHATPQLKIKQTFSTLPCLKESGDLVKVLESPPTVQIIDPEKS